MARLCCRRSTTRTVPRSRKRSTRPSCLPASPAQLAGAGHPVDHLHGGALGARDGDRVAPEIGDLELGDLPAGGRHHRRAAEPRPAGSGRAPDHRQRLAQSNSAAARERPRTLGQPDSWIPHLPARARRWPHSRQNRALKRDADRARKDPRQRGRPNRLQPPQDLSGPSTARERRPARSPGAGRSAAISTPAAW